MHSAKWLRSLVFVLLLSSALLVSLLASEPTTVAPLHIGIFTDLHAHDTDSPKEGWAYVTLDPVSRTIVIEGEGDQADWELQY